MTLLFSQDFDDRALRINPIVECNEACSYCAVGLDIPRMTRAPIEDWSRGFDRIPRGTFDVVSFSGGEPLLLRSLPLLANAATRHGMPARVYTNLSRDVSGVLFGLTAPIDWRATIHPETPIDVFIKNLLLIKAAKMAVTVVAIRVAPVEDKVAQIEREGWPVVWDGDLWGQNEKTQGVRPGDWNCTNHIWLFGPDGRRYPCVRHLMTKAHAGTLFWEVDWGQATRSITTRCSRFGDCLSCDGLIKSEVVKVEPEA